MSQLSKYLEKRIQELTASIEAQKAELSAYERVLHMETSKGSAPAETSEEADSPVTSSQPATRKKRGVRQGTKRAAAAVSQPSVTTEPVSRPDGAVAYAGNKTALVVDIVKSYGNVGATPKEVDGGFEARDVPRSKNLIYNTLSYLVAQGKLQRREGRYFGPAGGGSSAAPAKKAPPAAKKAAGTKRRLSPEGLKRIKDALRRRWAAKRAADAAAAKKK